MRITQLCRYFCTNKPINSSQKRVYRTPDEILSDGKLQTILKESNTKVDDKLSCNEIRLSILTHLSSEYGIPIPSNVYSELSSISAITEWYSRQLRPNNARPHARQLIHNTLGTINDENKKEELEKRIDLEREMIQKVLEDKLPNNLKLDEKTYLPPMNDWETGQRLKEIRRKWKKFD